MIIFLSQDFIPVDKKDAVMAKVIPDDGKPPYFIAVDNEDKLKPDA